jgi:hypothetical protein
LPPNAPISKGLERRFFSYGLGGKLHWRGNPMPRINIEEKLYVDPRFIKLRDKMGEPMAIGWLVILWRFAQQNYRDGILDIPHKSYEFYGFPDDLITFEFVEKTDKGYYIKGSKRNFEWINKNRESGKKGGEANAKRVLSDRLALPKRIEASSSSSSSKKIHNTTDVSPDDGDGGTSKVKKKLNTPCKVLYEHFIKVYKIKRGVDYVTNYGKDLSLIKKLLISIPDDHEIAFYIEKFFDWDNKFVSKAGYTIGIFYAKINQLREEYTYKPHA